MNHARKIRYSASWKSTFPGAVMGMLSIEEAPNSRTIPPKLEGLRLETEDLLQERYGSFSRKDLAELSGLAPYVAYYKGHRSTYHVLQQIESIAQGKKNIPAPSCHVLTMFMAELKSGLLTAGHHAPALGREITVDATKEGDFYTMLSGKNAALHEGDMCIRDEKGILSSILRGPNRESSIQDCTRELLFTVYAPPGIPPIKVEEHLREIESTIKIYAPERKILCMEIFENPPEN